MCLRRLVSFCTLLAFLLTGGLAGAARTDLCIEQSGTVQIQTPVDRCCGNEGEPPAPAPDNTGGRCTDCATCSSAPLSNGEGKLAGGRAIQSELPSDHQAPLVLIATMLHPPVDPAPSIAGPLIGRSLEPTHVSVPITVLRC
jgi:hypothetical protein